MFFIDYLLRVTKTHNMQSQKVVIPDKIPSNSFRLTLSLQLFNCKSIITKTISSKKAHGFYFIIHFYPLVDYLKLLWTILKIWFCEKLCLKFFSSRHHWNRRKEWRRLEGYFSMLIIVVSFFHQTLKKLSYLRNRF